MHLSRQDLYTSDQERASLFGNDHVLPHPTQQRYQGLQTLPLSSTDVRRSDLGYYKTTFFSRDKTLLDEPTFQDIPAGNDRPPSNPYFIPHPKPLEIATFDDQRIWVADKNAEMYERSILYGAKANEAQHLHGRQAWIQTLTENVRGKDRFTQTLQKPEDSFYHRHTQTNQVPTVTHGF